MVLLKGIIKNGQVVLPHPVDLADGTEVTVLTNGVTRPLGIPEADWPTDPEGISRLLERMARVEPFEMSSAEEAEIKGWREAVKQYTLANQDKAIDGLFE